MANVRNVSGNFGRPGNLPFAQNAPAFRSHVRLTLSPPFSSLLAGAKWGFNAAGASQQQMLSHVPGRQSHAHPVGYSPFQQHHHQQHLGAGGAATGGPSSQLNAGEVLDLSEFPALGATSSSAASNAGGGGGTFGGGSVASLFASGKQHQHQQVHQHQKEEFSMEDFPALPGAAAAAGPSNAAAAPPPGHQNPGAEDAGAGSQTRRPCKLFRPQRAGVCVSPPLTPPRPRRFFFPAPPVQRYRITRPGKATKYDVELILRCEKKKKRSAPVAEIAAVNIYATKASLNATPSSFAGAGAAATQLSAAKDDTHLAAAQDAQRAEHERWGLLGILKIIQMTHPDLQALALGTDLTNLGLNLNSAEYVSPGGPVSRTGVSFFFPARMSSHARCLRVSSGGLTNLYTSFSTPFTEDNQSVYIEPDYHLPACYNVQPPAHAHTKIGTFSDETLFYIFYSMPKDLMQETAAQEL
ncbi:MAG: hypothetical protein BJ554DRAFT_4636 [Olpidium bornovanus]|uniref:NOT2/NOT3/NOT5 C-terminal domain-containing protein n=1 Tax=Olpidium bornovanus TaxID=278681 RepID=A0A8H8DFC1_9FUNG|nr:MAG: hypothetical protein BJ554DRAFT_4636 [Olpidium bornovanus]